LGKFLKKGKKTLDAATKWLKKKEVAPRNLGDSLAMIKFHEYE